ncbi:hypothetical protein BJD20_20095 [Acinetobacter proteolyticus]|uniref:hypothetical protein n=1 Tax=Acinetobacter proteolyticus TaxID=1776741 RepID=UPI0008631AB4|nr:hypothetical protein [Acinetobacter proteolyticus]OEY93786.1 hypothetical protein BJD20_20095 [Acinetobacter proteolyticus]
MKKTILWSLLTLASSLSHSEELIAKATYDNQSKKMIYLEGNKIDEKKLMKCARLLDTKKGEELLKKLSKDKKEKVIEIKIKCKI